MLLRSLLTATLLVTIVVGCADSKPPLVRLREKADYFVETRQDERAVDEYKAFLDRKPEDTEIRYKYAQALSRVNRKPEAREQFSILVDVAPTDERFIDGYTQSLYEANALPELAAFLARMTTQRGSVRDFIRQGEFNLRAGDPDGAKTAYQTAAKLDGGRSTGPWIALADMYRGLGDLRSEKAMVERALFIAPMDPALSARYRTLGGIPGPTAGVRPEEYVEPAKK
jgi:tetratricopeptide (TPR) repeat protein